jgi:hypothetical protein
MLAYLARGSEAGLNIFLVAADGGTPRQLSHHATGVLARMPGDIAWAPDGSALYFLANDPLTDEQRERDKINVTANDDFRQVRLWKVAVNDGREEPLTTSDYSVTGLKVAANGSLVITRTPTSLVSDSLPERSLAHEAGRQRRHAAHRNKVPEGDACASPDGRRFFVHAPTTGRNPTTTPTCS